VPVDALRETRLLQLLSHRLRLERRDAVGPHQAAGVHEARHLVAGEQRPFEQRFARDPGVLAVRLDGPDEPLGIAVLAQHRCAVLRMLIEGRMTLVVEVVQEGDIAPRRLILGELPGVRTHGRLDRQGVAPKRLALRPLGEQRPRGVAVVNQVVGHVGDEGSRTAGCGRESGYSEMAVATATREGTVEAFLIEGGRPLSGTIRPAGNKNAALPILAACLLTADPVTLDNVPHIRDVEEMIELMLALGAEVEWTERNTVRVWAADLTSTHLDPQLCERIRASILLAGPLLARFGRADVPPPGGDVIGRRRIDTHLMAFAALGAEVEIGREYRLRAPRALEGAEIHL